MNRLVTFVDSADGLTPEGLSGFFEGWPSPPSAEAHLELLLRSDFVWLAVEEAPVGGGEGYVVGFITAISDHVLSAYVPLLEVLPEFRGRGIGSELLRRMLLSLSHLYMVDLVCDPATSAFYERHGMQHYSAMILRNRGALPTPAGACP